MYLRTRICAAISLLLTFAACEETSIVPGSVSTDYFPLEIGNYVIYELDSTRFDDFNMVVHRRTLEVRETVESTFIDAGGRESFRILREYRDGAGEVWGAAGYDVWSAIIDDHRAERVEENQRYVKLVFPLREGMTWLGTTYINVDPDGPLGYLSGQEYELSQLDVPGSYGTLNFDSTLTVIQAAEGTAIDTVGAREVYARGVGLVFKELWVLESQCTECDPDDVPCIVACQNSPWEEKAERGFIVRQEIKAYGHL